MGEAGDPSIAYLLGRIDVVRLRVAAVVGARRAVDGSAEDPFLGLYLSDEKIDALLRDERVWVPEDVARDRRIDVEAAADAAEAAGARLRLRQLAERFELDDLDVELLLTALAPDVDDRFERYYGYLNDDVTRRRVSVGLALGLAGVLVADRGGRDRLDQRGRLRSGGLAELEELDRPFLTRPLRVPDRVTTHLLGSDQPDPAVAYALVDVAPTGEPPDERLVLALRQRDAFVYVHDVTHGATEPIVDAAGAAGVPALVVDLERVGSAIEADALATAAVREARLRGGVLVAGPIDAVTSPDAGFLHRLTSQPVPLVLTGQCGWDPAWARRPPLVLEPPRLSGPARARLWTNALAGEDNDGFDPAEITAHYRLGAGQIRRAAAAAALTARVSGRAVRADDVRLGARQQNAARLERLARRIEPAVSWDDLVLPATVTGGLHSLAQRARHREVVLGEWGMRPGGGRGVGITALFAGDPGTGKTMSAEVVAHELGLDLYVVNLATVVDKYIGETEKNLDRIFAESDGVNGVLLFDEADALFGQRSEVRDSHDRYANIEVAYLLQRMETFDGLAVLATNLRSNVDAAFTRRLDVVVDFPMPDRALRRSLWGHCLGPLALSGDLDLDFCADAFDLSGGDIRAIAVTIGYRVAAGSRDVTMTDVIAAVGEEYRKLGRLCLEAEFGPYYPLLRGVNRVVFPFGQRVCPKVGTLVHWRRAGAAGDWSHPPVPEREETMPTYLSPGVYVEEIPSGSKPIEGVGTAIAAFVGMAPKGPVNEPILITNWRQYVEKFGDITAGAYLGHAVYGYLLNGGGNCFVVRIGSDSSNSNEVDQSSARARVGDLEVRALEPGPDGNNTTVEVGEPPEGSPEGTVRIVVRKGDVVEEHEAVPLAGRGNVVNTLNRSRLVRVELDPAVSQLENLPLGSTTLSGGELVHVDVTQARLSPEDYLGDSADRTGFAGLEAIPEITMVAVPDAMAAYQKGVIDLEGLKAIQVGMIAHCELMANRMAVLDAPPSMNAQQIKDWRNDQAGYDSKFAALYYPWLKVFDPSSGENTFVPPSGHVAGIWGRNDDTRGVHKAPANEVVRGALDLEVNITKGEHDLLNPDGVNCIRSFPGQGIRIWGARTLSSDPEWKYVNVRRLFNYLEDSILSGTQWAVFEPNDNALWAKLRRSISAFLVMEWRKGALFGLTPAEAFYVKCDGETNPAEAIDVGQVTCQIGVAPVKPAEFVVFQLSQFSGGTSLVAE